MSDETTTRDQTNEPSAAETTGDGTLPAAGVAPEAGPQAPGGPRDVPAHDFERVLAAELDAIRRGRALRRGAEPAEPEELPDRVPAGSAIADAHDARLTGLAVSGGGIRSATFNLGVIQALARLGLLRRFDYLSVNSGGGYIGSWLSSWVRRKGLREVERALAADACRNEEPPEEPVGDGQADPFEDEGRAASGQEVEAGPVRFLRRFSNYLTPQLGLFSADTWTLVATYLRNLLLNLVVVILVLGVILLSPRLVLLLSRVFDRDDAYGLILGAVLALAVAIGFIGLNLAEMIPERSHRWSWFSRQGWIQALVVLPLFVAAWLAALWLWYSEAGALADEGGVELGHRDLLLGRWLGERPLFGWYADAGLDAPAFEPLAWALLAALVYGGVWVLGGIIYWAWSTIRRRERPRWTARVWRAVIVSAPVAGAVGGALIYSLTAAAHGLEGLLESEYRTGSWHLLHINVWKAPGIILIFLLTAFAHTGLMGRAFPESMRQWWSRLGAWMLIYSITWVGLFGIAIYGPIVLALLGQWIFAAVTATWAGATAAGVVVGRETAEAEAGGNRSSGRVKKLVIAAAPQIFIVGVLALVALGLHAVLSPAEPLETGAVVRTAEAGEAEPQLYPGSAPPAAYGPMEQAMAAERLSTDCGFFWVDDPEGTEPARRRIDAGRVLQCHSERLWKGTTPGRTLGLLGILLAGALVFSWRVDINEFSMHLFYRNRLIRAYLGASNDEREAQPFTGFDPEDDLALADFVPEHGYDGPYPIHNATLNLVAGQELAWQERKGASFVFTPLATGFEVHEGKTTRKLEEHGFRPTQSYRQTEHGVSVGTAVAISGAAASPNMGASTTPAMAFLLTVFNVRLGWWLGNPRHRKTWYRMGPRVGAAALLAELFGSTDEESRYVYLSDGGHFENLAVYELVRRRCRFILASDAGADPESTFEDLGNAIRKCCTDFGIEIDIDTERIFHDPQDRRSLWHCAVGSIRYDKVDPGASPGVLLYLKASLTGDEARDVLAYGVRSPTFPHESTGDQFFGESQFESYRKLGEHVAMTVFDRADDAVRELSQEVLMVRLQEAWYPPSGAPQGAFTQHARQLDALFERLRESQDLRFLLQQIYPEWRVLVSQLPERRGEPRPEPELWLPDTHDELAAGFLFCHSLIQVMENVYLDLALESEHSHPDNRGWLNLFKHWTWSGMVRATWAITAGTFGARFQNFCRRRLGFEPGRLLIEEHRLRAGEADALLTRMRSEHRLNFLEESLVRGLLEKNRGELAPDRLFVLRMEVREPMAAPGAEAEEMRFTFGFAVARGGDLVFIRIQDHVRKMGLGRKALAELVREHGITGVDTPHHDRMPDYVQTRPAEARIDTLRELFGSVLGDGVR